MADASSERELVRRAQGGDQGAMRALLRESGEAVRARIASRITRRWRSLLSADDVMQQTYAEAIRNIHRFEVQGEGSFENWLSRIALCNLNDGVRALETDKRGGNRQRLTSVAGEDGRVTLLRLLSGGGTAPERKAGRREAKLLLDEAVARLPAVYRQVVDGMDLHGRQAAEMARELGRSVGAVHMLRARAHDRLRQELGAPGDFFTDSA